MRGKNKTYLKRTLNGVGIFSSVFLFTAAAIWLYSPTFGTNAAEQSSFRVGANVKSNISIISDSQVVFDIANGNQTTSTKGVKVKVYTTVEGGYDLYMASEVENNSLESTSSSYEIKSITAASSSLNANMWAYKLDGTSGNYQPIPKPSKMARIKSVSSNPVGEESLTTVNFTIRSAHLIEGTYRKNIVFTAVALENSVPTEEDDPSDLDTRTIFDITYMHEISRKICANTTTPKVTATEYVSSHTTNDDFVPQTILTDARDNKTYLVRKYADGNCWMAQNLELDFKPASGNYSYNNTTLTVTTLDPQYTDIESPELFNRSDNAFRTNTFYATQAAFGSSSNSLAWALGDSRSFSVSGANVADYMVKRSVTNAGMYLFEESYSGERYQKIGNFYTINAALAGYNLVSGEVTISENSICPKHWQLPEATGNKSITELVSLYSPSNGDNVRYKTMVDQPLTMYPTGTYSPGYGEEAGYRNYKNSIVYLHRPESVTYVDGKIGSSNYNGSAFRASLNSDGSVTISNYYAPYSFSTNGAIRCVAR